MTVDPDPLGDAIEALREDPEGYVATLFGRIDRAEPDVRAFVEQPERDRVESAVVNAGGPLHGAPVGVKDVFHAEGFPTRAGSDLPPDVLAGPEATAVSRLREAGATAMGKTVTTEFAYFAPGPTRNPHDPGRTPGGSSSGSAAAVAAGFCPLALGTQTVGSVIRPAAFCGVVGFKPSYGRVPTDGLVPFSASADHVGTFTADVGGAALAASILCEGWTPATPDREPVLGIPEGSYLDQADEGGRRAFERGVDELAAAGYEVRRVSFLEDIAAVNDRHRAMIAAEMALAHDEWFAAYGDRYADETADLIREGRSEAVGDLADARNGRLALRERLGERMDAAGVDLWLSPAAPGPAPEGIDDTGDPVMNLPWTHAGIPAVTVPAGTVDGLPVGMQVAGRFAADEELLARCERIAAALG